MKFLKNKILFCFALLYLVLLTFDVVTNFRGRDFPKPNQLTYSTGTLYTEYIPRQGKSQDYLNVYLYDDHLKQHEPFSCDYGEQDANAITSCDRNVFEPYDKQQVKIGWYQPQTLLWYPQVSKQLVTLTVDNKEVVSYQDTLQKLHVNNIQMYIHAIFMPLAMTLMLYSFFMILRFIFSDIRRDKENVT